MAFQDETGVLAVRLLGDVVVRRGLEPVRGFESTRLQSLLGYLILHRDAPQARQRLAFLLWPESNESQARTNLRQLLYYLRRALPDGDRLVAITPGTIQWCPRTPVRLDVADFEEAAARAQTAGTGPGRRTALEEAVSAYGGDLLPGCYEDWVAPERERLRQCYIELLDALATLLEKLGDHAAAVRYGEKLLRCDGLHEATYRRLMRLHLHGGERARALRVYHLCSSVLERELGVEPSRPTQDAYAALLNLELAAGPSGAFPVGDLATVPLVGRQVELDRATETWREAAAGRALLLLVAGEAGLGKTRLVEELERWCTREGIVTARTRAYAAEGRLAYAPVVDWLRSDGLRPGLVRLEPVWLSEVARLLPELLVERPGLDRPEPLTARDQRQRLFEALARGILGTAQPLLLVIDDLQWCDQETLEFLHYLVRFDLRAPLLVAATARPEEIDPTHAASALCAGLHGIERIVEIGLSPLGRAEVSSLARHLSTDPLDAESAERLYRETEGNPLFVVETVRSGLPAAADAAGPTSQPARREASVLPARVRSTIERRLNHLSAGAGALVPVAATIGRAFTHQVLAAASELDEDSLVAAIDELWRRRIIREQGAHSYDFSHDKIREVAYAAVGPGRRRQLHLSVARALSGLHAADPAPVSAQLAVHYDRAGQTEPAVRHYQQAAAVAQAVFANQEAAPLLIRALELLDQLPPGPVRDDQELALRVALGVTLVALQGYNSAPVEANYRRADELCVRLGRPPSPPVLRGLALAAIEWCQFERAVEPAQRLLDLGRDSGEGYLAVEGDYLLGVTAFWRGELAAARDHLERALATYRPEDHGLHIARFAQDPKVVCLCRLALTQWYRGRGETASRLMRESLALAETLRHPVSHCYALMFAAWLAGERRDFDATMTFAQAQESIAVTHGLVSWSPPGIIWSGWAQAQQGRPEAGLARMLQGFEKMDEVGLRTERTYLQLLLSQAQTLAGQPAAGLRTVREALDHTQRTGPPYLEAELRRAEAELLLRHADHNAGPETDAALRSASELARRQGARLLELRTAMSMLRRSETGGPQPRTEARATLTRILEELPEVADTPDANAALSLLGQHPDGRMTRG